MLHSPGRSCIEKNKLQGVVNLLMKSWLVVLNTAALFQIFYVIQRFKDMAFEEK